MCRPLIALLILTMWFSCVRPVSAEQPSPDQADAVKRQLDRQPAWDETPFAPAEGSITQINPPAFVWLPLSKRPVNYTLAVSRSGDFPEGETTVVDDVPISVHVPTEPMAAGRWHWRVGVRLTEGRFVWSKARSFTIADDAAVWPLPKIDELVAKIPKDHPRLLFPGEELERVRKLCKTTMAREYRSLLRSAERAIGEKLVPEPPFERAEDRGTGKPTDYVYIMRSTRRPMDKMETCALAYLLSGEERFGREAKRRLLHFFAWDPDGSTSLFRNDEPAMWVMQRGTRAYDWTHDLFTPEERARIEPVMKARCRQFLRRLTRMPFESRPYSSHPARDLGFLGEAAIVFIHEWPEASGWLDYVTKIYWSVYPAWAGEDGGWQEGPSYWRAYMGFALHFVAALEKATGADLARKPFFRNTPYYKLYTNPPYARMSPFGDGHSRPPGRGAGQLMYQFSTLLQDPYIRWYADVQESGPGDGPLGFALADPSLEARAPADLPQARLFAGAGLVAMHADLADPDNNAYLVMRSSPFGSISHGHADQNAFVVEAFGEALAIASGYYPWYSSPHHHNWTRQTKAVNSVTIDGGIGQTARSAQAAGRIAEFLTGPDYDYALGDATAAYDGRLTRFLRHVVHVRPGTFVIIDELKAPKPVTFEWWLHALEEMQIDTDAREVLISRGDARLAATFIQPQKLRFAQTDRFDPPPENNAPNQWHLTASTAEKTDACVFFVVLAPYKVGSKPPELIPIRDGDVLGVVWQQDDVQHEILYCGRSGIRARDVRTDAKLLALKKQDGKLAAWLAVDAKKLVVDNSTLINSSQPETKTSARRQ